VLLVINGPLKADVSSRLRLNWVLTHSWELRTTISLLNFEDY
jgi:hypothetical protein